MASPAPSAEPAAEADPSAQFSQAETLYREGRYEEAIEILEALIEAHDAPILRFNLGRAYESAGLLDPAIAAYQEYLQTAPDAPDRDSVKARIERLESRAPDESEPVPTPDPVQPRAPVERDIPPRKPVIAPWVLAGAGGVGLIVGGAFAGVSVARGSEAEDLTTNQVRAVQAQDEARRFSTLSIVTLAVGGALLVAGVTWGVLATKRQRRSDRAVGANGLTLRF